MSLSVCPIATVQTPAEAVWALLREPEVYALWWDARTDSIHPEGPAKPGKRSVLIRGRWEEAGRFALKAWQGSSYPRGLKRRCLD